jgi:2,3-bisphosphoglycerate-dependent phosphoglycerate mutase
VTASEFNHPLPLLFETHATSLDNEGGLASGWYDVDLSPRGEVQARELGERYRDRAVQIVFCSDLRRSYRTAEIAFEGRSGIPIVQDARLRECNYGALTRHSTAEIDAMRASTITAPFPAGESYEQVTARVAGFLDEVGRLYREPVLVIGHRGTYYALEHLLNGVPLKTAIEAAWSWRPGWSYELLRVSPSA